MRNLRKPLVPLFKVYDLRRNLSDYIEKFFTQSALCFARISVNRQSGHPVKFNGMFPYSLNLIVFACALSFPFFKLSHTFFAVEKVHDRRDKRASQRINLVLRYSRVVFPSRHSPLLCNLLDSLSPFIRLFSFYLPPRSLPCGLNDGAVFFARDLFKRASNSFG